MSYAIRAQFYAYMGQLTSNTTTDARVDEIQARAYDIVNQYLGFTLAAYPGSATTQVVLGEGTSYLRLPPHEAASVTTVTDLYGTTITGWAEDDDGALFLASAYPGLNGGLVWQWGKGHRFTVTAKWGYGPAPDSVVEVELEIAVNLWREKEKGSFSDVIGVEGGGAIAVGYQKALTNRQKMILDQVMRSFAPLGYF